MTKKVKNTTMRRMIKTRKRVRILDEVNDKLRYLYEIKAIFGIIN